MTIHIDLHIVATILTIVFITALLAIWARFSLRLAGFIPVLCASMTLIVASQSDLEPEHIQSIFLSGGIATAAFMVCFFAVQSATRRRHRLPARAKHPQAIHYVERPSRQGQPVNQRVQFVPAPVEDDHELEEYEEEPEEQYYQVRQPRPRQPRYAATTEEARPVQRVRRPVQRLQYVNQGQRRAR